MAEDIRERSDAGAPVWSTLAEAAAVVGVSAKTIRRAVKAGTIAGERAGDSEDSPWLVRLEDVEARWGDQGGAATSHVAASAEQGEIATEMPDAAQTGDAPAVGPETRNRRVGERLSELRRRLVVSEPERRWWQRAKR